MAKSQSVTYASTANNSTTYCPLSLIGERAFTSQTLLNGIDAFPCFQAIYCLVEFRTSLFSNFACHLTHQTGHRARIIFVETVEARGISKALHARLIAHCEGHAPDQAAQFGGRTLRAGRGCVLDVFVAGISQGKSMTAVLAAIIVAGHDMFLLQRTV